MTASQVRTTSSSTCEDRSTRTSSSAERRRTSASISSRPDGSSPFVGSSSTTICGPCTSAWASFTRCFMPVEKPCSGRARSSSRPTWKRISEARSTAARCGRPRSSARCVTRSERRHRPRQAVVLGHVADRGADLRGVARGVEAEHGEPAGVGLEQAEERAHQRRLAGAVRAEQPHGRLVDREGHAAQRLDRAEPLRDRVGGEGRRHRGHRPRLPDRSPPDGVSSRMPACRSTPSPRPASTRRRRPGSPARLRARRRRAVGRRLAEARAARLPGRHPGHRRERARRPAVRRPGPLHEGSRWRASSARSSASLFWLLVRGDITGVVGGRSGWPVLDLLAPPPPPAAGGPSRPVRYHGAA